MTVFSYSFLLFPVLLLCFPEWDFLYPCPLCLSLHGECRCWIFSFIRIIWLHPLIARFMGPTWSIPRADRTQVGPRWATWTLLSGSIPCLYALVQDLVVQLQYLQVIINVNIFYCFLKNVQYLNSWRNVALSLTVTSKHRNKCCPNYSQHHIWIYKNCLFHV